MLIGKSNRMERLKRELIQAASCLAPVLLTGASGTGKELSARFIHEKSGRLGPFVAVNCTTLTENLADSELFGYAENAFTGARTSRIGLCEHADGGTLFLDEVADLPLSVQAKLLRFLDSGQIRRVGSVTIHSVNVKVISATNRELLEAVSSKDFRADLYYRLSAIRVQTPSLSEHLEDIPALADHLLHELGITSGISPSALSVLRHRGYSGNVRELRNVLAQAAARAEGGIIRTKHLSPESQWMPSATCSLKQATCDAQRKRISDELHRCHYNLGNTALSLGIHRNTLRRLMRALEM